MVSLRPNYYIFIGYLKTGVGGGGEGGSSEPPLTKYCVLIYQKPAHQYLHCFQKMIILKKKDLNYVEYGSYVKLLTWKQHPSLNHQFPFSYFESIGTALTSYLFQV